MTCAPAQGAVAAERAVARRHQPRLAEWPTIAAETTIIDPTLAA